MLDKKVVYKMLDQMMVNRRDFLFFLKKLGEIKSYSVPNVCQILWQTNGQASFLRGEIEYKETYASCIKYGAKPIVVLAPTPKGDYQEVTVYDISDTDMTVTPSWTVDDKTTLDMVYKVVINNGIKVEIAGMDKPLGTNSAKKTVFLNRNNNTIQHLFNLLKGYFIVKHSGKMEIRLLTANAICFALEMMTGFHKLSGETLPNEAYQILTASLKTNIEFFHKEFQKTFRDLDNLKKAVAKRA